MLSTKTTTVLALLTTLTILTHAAPPACVIGAVNTQTNPHDIAAVCKASDVQDYINQNCGGNQEAAQKYFSEVCQGAGVTISATVQDDGNSTSSASPSSSSGSSDDDTVPSAISRGSQAQASTTSSEKPASTGGAARLGMDVMGLVAVGCFGLMAAL